MAPNGATCANGDIRYSPWPVIRVRIEERRGLDLDEAPSSAAGITVGCPTFGNIGPVTQPARQNPRWREAVFDPVTQRRTG